MGDAIHPTPGLLQRSRWEMMVVRTGLVGGGSGLRGGWNRVEFDCPSDTICRVVDFGVLMNEREASKMTPAFEAQTAGSMKVWFP